MATNLAVTNDKSDEYWLEQLAALETGDFEKVILEGYFTEKALDNVTRLATITTDEGGREAIVEELVAISLLQKHLKTIKTFGTLVLQDQSELREEG